MSMHTTKAGDTQHQLTPNIYLSGIDGQFALKYLDNKGVAIGKLEGFLAGPWVQVSHIEVAEGFRSQGVGTCMLRTLETYACATGRNICHVDVRHFSLREFFEDRGFATQPFDIKSQGDIPRLYMRKKLQLSGMELKEAA